MCTAASSTKSPEQLGAPEVLAMGCRRRRESLLTLRSENSLVGVVWCEWQWDELAGFVQNGHGFVCWCRGLQAEFRHWQVVAGAGECVRSMWDVRGRHGQWQEGGGGKAVADTAGRRQTYQ